MRDVVHKGAGRDFRAFARPQGDPAAGITGPLVEVQERCEGFLARVRLLPIAEATQLRDELDAALRAFTLARELAEGVAGLPRADSAPFPLRGVTLADVGFC